MNEDIVRPFSELRNLIQNTDPELFAHSCFNSLYYEGRLITLSRLQNLISCYQKWNILKKEPLGDKSSIHKRYSRVDVELVQNLELNWKSKSDSLTSEASQLVTTNI